MRIPLRSNHSHAALRQRAKGDCHKHLADKQKSVSPRRQLAPLSVAVPSSVGHRENQRHALSLALGSIQGLAQSDHSRRGSPRRQTQPPEPAVYWAQGWRSYHAQTRWRAPWSEAVLSIASHNPGGHDEYHAQRLSYFDSHDLRAPPRYQNAPSRPARRQSAPAIARD